MQSGGSKRLRNKEGGPQPAAAMPSPGEHNTTHHNRAHQLALLVWLQAAHNSL